METTGYKLTTDNQVDDYGTEKAWRMSKQAPRKRKSQIASAVEVSTFYSVKLLVYVSGNSSIFLEIESGDAKCC